MRQFWTWKAACRPNLFFLFKMQFYFIKEESISHFHYFKMFLKWSQMKTRNLFSSLQCLLHILIKTISFWMKDVLNVIENHKRHWSQVKQKCQTDYWVLLFWEAYLKYPRLDLYQINSFKWINPMYLCDRRFYCVSAIYLSVFQKIDNVTSPLTSAVVGPSCVCRSYLRFLPDLMKLQLLLVQVVSSC